MKKILMYLLIVFSTTAWVIPEDLAPQGPPVGAVYTQALDLPPTFDWRDTGLISSAKDQHSCGACWAFSSAAILEFKLAQTDIDVDLSEQFLVDYSGAGSCEGGYMSRVNTFLTQTGDIPEECLPYSGIYQETDVNPCDGWTRQTYALQRWDHIYPIYEPEEIKVAIYTHGPVVAIMTVYFDFMYHRGWIYIDKGIGNTLLGYHSVVVTGWDDNLECFIIKNSWGTSWGEQGFACVPYQEVYSARTNFGYQIYTYSEAFQVSKPEPDPLVQSKTSGGGGGGCFISSLF